MKLRKSITIAACASAALVPATAAPLKVYILAGQSNMQGHATEWVLPGMAADPVTKGLHDQIVDAEGHFRVHEDVRVAALNGSLDQPVTKSGPLTMGFGGNLEGRAGERSKYAIKFGPELGFGLTMREHLREPFLIIKTAWGGKSLRKDFLSPSGVKVVGGDAETGANYRAMCEFVKTVLEDPATYCPTYDPRQGYEVSGFVWFQGWNDMMGAKDPFYQATEDQPAFAAYSELLACFIRDVRQEFKTPDMPFVIGVIGTGGKADEKNPFREAMAAPATMPEFKGKVVAVRTAEYFDEKLNELVDRSWRWQRPAWDPEKKYGELRAKLQPLQEQLNESKKIEDQVERAKMQKEINDRMQAILYTDEEKAYIDMNKSNTGYHYLGSGKILGRIGEAFAKAMIALEEQR